MTNISPNTKRASEDEDKDPEKKKKKGPPPSADEMLDTRKRTFIGDVAFPWTSNRAGVAAAMARASGTPYKDIPWNIKYPLTTTAIPASASMFAGNLAGAGLGFATGVNPLVASMLGGGLGLVAGLAGTGFFRRRHMNRIKDQYDASAESGDLDVPDSIDMTLRGRLGMLGAPHRIARQRAYNEMDAGETKSETPRQLRNVAQLLANSYTTSLAAPFFGVAEDIATARNIKKTKRDTGSGESDEPRNRKKASNPHPLLRYV